MIYCSFYFDFLLLCAWKMQFKRENFELTRSGLQMRSIHNEKKVASMKFSENNCFSWKHLQHFASKTREKSLKIAICPYQRRNHSLRQQPLTWATCRISIGYVFIINYTACVCHFPDFGKTNKTKMHFRVYRSKEWAITSFILSTRCIREML